jgi:hypothetical protein
VIVHRIVTATTPRARIGIGIGILVLAAGWSVVPPAAAAGGTGGPDLRHPAAAVPVITQVLPDVYDPAASYEAQSQCDSTPKPGALALAGLIRKTYGPGQYVGISRACSSGGTSEHKEGRALDWSTSARSPRGRANAEAFVAWLLGPDQFGNANGNATRLGVMYIGWDDRFWAAYDANRGWTELKGCFSRPGAGNDTDCHRNHVHISLTWDGASGRTSFWDGTALAPYCPSARSDATVPVGGRSTDVVAITPVRVLSTRDGNGLTAGSGFGGWGGHEDGHGQDGLGTQDGFGARDGFGSLDAPLDGPSPTPLPVAATPCRVHPAGWHGDSDGVLTTVIGQGEVPVTGVVAVAVTVRALGSTAPADITVWSPGMVRHETLAHARMNGNARGSAIVPVASDGTIAVGTSAGATDLTVDITGYYLAGDQPNSMVVAGVGR